MFQQATRKQSRLRLAVIGPAGAGKSFTLLRIAHALRDELTEIGELPKASRIALIDTEHGSASLYADDDNPDGGQFVFDVVDLGSWIGKFCVENYIKAIQGAADAGYPLLIIDSLSHAWSGAGGVLEYVDSFGDKAKFSKGWRTATPKHNALVEAILAYPGHVLISMRSKVAYVVETDDRGRNVPRKIGLQPVQREGLDYEFGVVGDLEQETKTLSISKTRCRALTGRRFVKAGADVAEILAEWLTAGEAFTEPATGVKIPDWTKEEATQFARDSRIAANDVTGDQLEGFLISLGKPAPGYMAPAQRAAVLQYIRTQKGRAKLDQYLHGLKFAAAAAHEYDAKP